MNTVQAVEILISPLVGNQIPQYWPFLISGLVVTKIAVAVDGYREAKAA